MYYFHVFILFYFIVSRFLFWCIYTIELQQLFDLYMIQQHNKYIIFEYITASLILIIHNYYDN